MMEKILITGGAGYLGCVLAEHLLSQGYAVTVLDNLYYQQHSLLNLCLHSNFNFIRADVRDKELIERILPEFNAILPLAAIVGAPACENKKHEAKTINQDAVIMINELRKPHQKLIFPTTNSGYGIKSKEVICTEETSLNPISFYGQTKVEAEKALLKSSDVITLRLATVFGVSPRMRTDLLVNDFVQRALFDRTLVLFEKHFKRNYIHILDVARCFEHCLKNYEQMKGQAYNVGLEEANLSKEELALKIKEHLPEVVIITEDFAQDLDQRNYIVSNQKLYATGFKPRYSLDFGIKELIQAYKILGNRQFTNM